MTSRDVMTEQAIAFGRSTAWMLAHGYTRDDIDGRRVARANRRSVRDNGGDNKTVGPGGASTPLLRGLTLEREG